MKADVTAHDMKLSVGSVVKYRMTMPNGDTMFALVDDASGLLVIYEYDGTWGHWWNPAHIGKATLSEFLLFQSCEYIANKIVPHDKHHCIDVEATIKAHQEAAIRRGHEDDEDLMEKIEKRDWDEVVSGVQRDPLDEAGIDGEHWNLIQYEDTRWLKTVRDICIPLLKRALEQAAAAKVA
jgi:hypothetical protein